MLKNELYKAFINKRFLFVLLIEIFLILWYTIGEAIPVMNDHVKFVNDYIYAGRNMEKMTNRLPLGAYYLWIGFNYCKQRVVLYAVLPILAAIPYGASLTNDMHNDYVSLYITKLHKVLLQVLVKPHTTTLFVYKS